MMKSRKGYERPSSEPKDTSRYWKDQRGSPRGLHWVECTNARGLELPHCDALLRAHGRGRLTVQNLHEADVYSLGDIHLLAEQECAHGARGDFAGYGWTDKLLHYAPQSDFQGEIAALAPLTDVPAPEHPGTAMQCLHDRQAQYRSHHQRARADRVQARDMEPHQPTTLRVDDADPRVKAADRRGAELLEMNASAAVAIEAPPLSELQEPELDDELEV